MSRDVDEAAEALLRIIETGKHTTAFGNVLMETAAQSILALHARIAGLVKRHKELTPASLRPMTFKRKRE